MRYERSLSDLVGAVVNPRWMIAVKRLVMVCLASPATRLPGNIARKQSRF